MRASVRVRVRVRVRVGSRVRVRAIRDEGEVTSADQVVCAGLDEYSQVGHIALGHLLGSHDALAPLVRVGVRVRVRGRGKGKG